MSPVGVGQTGDGKELPVGQPTYSRDTGKIMVEHCQDDCHPRNIIIHTSTSENQQYQTS